MSGDLNRRLNKLQVIAGGKGCPSCRDWDTTTVEIGTRDQLPVHLARPEKCPDCGRRAPQTTAVVQIVAPDLGDDESAGCLGNG